MSPLNVSPVRDPDQSECGVEERRQDGIGRDPMGREARERGAHQGEVARRPRQTERDPQLRRRESRLTRVESLERPRSDECPLERQTQVARVRGRQPGPLGAGQRLARATLTAISHLDTAYPLVRSSRQSACR